MIALRALLQQRQERGRHEVQLRHVRAVQALPLVEAGLVEEFAAELLCGGELGVLRGGRDPGVVDQDVQGGLFGGDLLDEGLDGRLGCDVCCQRDDLPWDVLRVERGDPVELFFCAAGYVYLGAVDGEGLRGH